ncbi:hypothetical protein bcCo53_001235 (plasmid) [Borrelia coriaceae]|uniref:Uncharacterized protein n=1 Tax=Borrelia coriaceae ATCC 43381 TaxID=1408429 RepID=W5SWI6_9SPIR|nr:hypothetical protein [Borrelia coriaceae]AHH11053.1 Hypothetical protein BCO_0004400 [Borrelia coriaceae ATCC 43381]UPA17066.1 hypothetical protein bcCo53_001235 [Borrelia coriaceae]
MVDYIQEVVTNPDIGKAEGYKTYKVEEFFKLLKILGNFKIKDIIKHCFKVDNFQKAFNGVIDSVNDGEKRERLRVKFYGNGDNYDLYLKGLFSGGVANSIYENSIYEKVMSGDYISCATT